MKQINDSVKRALVVEDEPGIAKVCMRILAGKGFQVDIAANGIIALDMWHKVNYDLCLSDIRTPEMNGIELYQRLANENPEIVSKFIFTTGDVLSSNIKKFLDETKRLYLTKPFTPDELRTLIETVTATEPLLA